MKTILFIALFALLIVVLLVWRQWQKLQRAAYIRTFVLPPGLYSKLQKHYPHLSLKDCQLAAKGLRQFFGTYLAGGRKPVSMPSQVVDALWHEFILYTKHYQAFCDKAFGGFMHHKPAVVMGSDQSANLGLKRCFYFACRDENIDPNKPLSLPLLFAIDAKLNIPDGFRYVADCDRVRRQQSADASVLTAGAVYCGGDFAKAGDGGTAGFSDVGDSGGGDGGDGGGCGGGCGS